MRAATGGRQLPLALALAVSLGLSACGDKDGPGAAGDTGGAGPPPDIAGRYQAFVSSVSGCGNDPSWVQDWAEGPLLVEGSGGSLTFDFYDGVSFSGRVSADNTYIFSGVFTHDGAELDVYHAGDVSRSDDATVLEGRFEIEVDDDEFEGNNCTLVSDLRATEIVGE